MTNDNHDFYTATYSAEDNKLRIYADVRLDDETYSRAKELGFKWARIQGLFVAPKWTPAREDFCIELAGTIEAEKTTVVERAEAKAQRLDYLAYKRSHQSDAYLQAANRISQRFENGQPILVGHHSERKARKDQEKMQRAMDQAVKAHNAVSYWQYRAEGVERHANRKADPGVRARRIKTLLAELRDRQRDINHANICLDLWEKLKAQHGSTEFDEKVKMYAGCRLKSGSMAPYYRDESLWDQLGNGTIGSLEAVDKCIDFHKYQSQNPYTFRWINHILNRLAFERSELGAINRYDGSLTAVILQGFARENGADKPKAVKTAIGFKLTSPVPLPLHFAEGKELELTNDQWLDLMVLIGYEVPAPKPKPAPILNFRAKSIKSYNSSHEYPQVSMTKSEYNAIHNDYRGVRTSYCNTFRFRVCMQHALANGSGYGLVSVFLTDSKENPTPESKAVITEAVEV